MIDESISFADYDPKWPVLFKEEAEKIKSSFEPGQIHVEHIGSTAVAGLSAKPIIDIQIGVEFFTFLKETIRVLEKLEYEYLGEAGVPDRHHFRKRGNIDYNVHIVLWKGELWTNNILVRDYLRKHKQAADEYGRLKAEAIKKGINTLLAYSDHKAKFISGLIRKAKE